MHLQADQVNIIVKIVFLVITLKFCFYAVSQAKRGLMEGQVPLMGAGAVFILLLHLIPLPLTSGLRGHFLGILLLASMLGPWLAFLLFAVVSLIQTLVFSQGSIATLGINIFNIGVIAGVGGYQLLKFFKKLFPYTKPGFYAATFAATWSSYFFAVLAADLALVLPGTVLDQAKLIEMAALYGLLEAIFTTVIVMIILASRPDLLISYCCGGDKDVCYAHHHHKHTHDHNHSTDHHHHH